MADSRPRSGPAPWITAGVLVVIAGVLAAVVWLVAYPARDRYHKSEGQRVFSTSERAAMRAASTEAINLLTYSRNTFDADYARSVAGTTGQLHSDLAADKASTLAQMTKGKFDLKATVSDTALESGSADKGYLVLVVATGYKVTDDGKTAAAPVNRLELTLVNVKGKWLVSDLKAVSLT